jgi:hypothetical protein
MSNTQTYPWERLPGETDKAYAAFLVYLELPPFRRSLLEVARCLYPAEQDKKGQKRTDAPGALRRWFAENNWTERAQVFDLARIQRDLEQNEQERDAALAYSWKGLVTGIQQQNERIVAATQADCFNFLKLDPDQLTRWMNCLRETIKFIEQGDPATALAELEAMLAEAIGPQVRTGQEAEAGQEPRTVDEERVLPSA